MPCVAIWRDREVIILSESQTEKDKYLWYHSHSKLLKKGVQMNLFTKQK